MNIIQIATKALQEAIKTVVDTILGRTDVTTSSRQASWGAVAGTKTNIDNTAASVGSNADASSSSGSVHAKLKELRTVAAQRQADWGATSSTKLSIGYTEANVGSNSDASSATGSVHAKLKDLKTTVTSGGNTIKSIQRGTLTMNNTSNTVTISAIDISKSILVMNDRSTNTTLRQASGIITNSTTLTFTANDVSNGVPVVNWEVIEYK